MIDILLILLIGWSLFSHKEKWTEYYESWTGGDATPEAIRKRKLLSIARRMNEEGLSLDELSQAMASPEGAPAHAAGKAPRNIAQRIFAVLGGVFIFASISTYLGMFWATLPPFMHVLCTLGLGIALCALTIVAMKENRYPRIVLPLSLLYVGLETFGWFVLLYELYPHFHEWDKGATFVFGVMAIQHACILVYFRSNLLALVALTFAYSCLFQLLCLMHMRLYYICMLVGGCIIFTSYTLRNTPFARLRILGYCIGAVLFNCGFYDYIHHTATSTNAAILTGLTVCSMAYGFERGGINRLPAIGYFIGTILLYCGLFDCVHHTHYELAYLGIAVAMLYVAALLQSRAILTTTVIAILSFIGYYTNEYFVDSVGWPIALLILGVLFLGVSAGALKFKRYFNI